MITLVALPVIASWTVVLTVLGLIGWATVGRLMQESARMDAGIKQTRDEADDQKWFEDLGSETSLYDRLSLETYRRQLDEGRQA